VIARLLLVFVLLAGWQAALVHPIQHVDSCGALVHLGDRDGDHGSAKGELCDILSALAACATPAFAFFRVETPHTVVPVEPRFTRRQAQAPPFLSQGPPPLL
jgi:hypothetical protein